MKYKIVSNGDKFRVMEKKYWYSKWRYVYDVDLFSIGNGTPITYDTLDQTERVVKEWIVDDIKKSRKWDTVKIVSITDLEIALYTESNK